MDLNNLELSPSVITDLYKNNLIESVVTVSSEIVPAGDQKKKEPQYLGRNQKGICLLVNYPDDVYLPDNQLQFLTVILQACKLNLADVAIVNYSRQKISFKELKKQVECKYLLIFGLSPAAIGLEELTPFTVHNIERCQVICAPAAGELNNDNAESKLLKTKLWICLKKMFHV